MEATPKTVLNDGDELHIMVANEFNSLGRVTGHFYDLFKLFYEVEKSPFKFIDLKIGQKVYFCQKKNKEDLGRSIWV